MDRRRAAGVFGGLIVAGVLAASGRGPIARGQRAPAAPAWEHRVVALAYNPGERQDDRARALAFEREINRLAAEGWELVGSVLGRDTVQTVGGAVTTRETVSFVAFRRPRR